MTTGPRPERVTHALVRDVTLPRHLGTLALITLDNGLEGKPTTLGPVGLAELASVLRSVQDRVRSGELAAVAVTGKPWVFAAGADLTQVATVADREQAFALGRAGHAAYELLHGMGVPTFAFVNGTALGGGLELALACDIRIAADDAKLGLPEVTLGIFPAAGGTRRLPRLVGDGWARELVFTGRHLGALEAERIGLVNRVVPAERLEEEALALARQIAQNDDLALRMAKLALLATAHGRDSDAFEKAGQALLFDSPGKRERMQAFLDRKRSAAAARGEPVSGKERGS